MSFGLQHSSDGGEATCAHCGAKAVGPCARCHAPVCGDCCVLTDGGAQLWAICLRCEASGGRSLTRGWLVVAGWLLVPLLVLFAAVVALSLASAR